MWHVQVDTMIVQAIGLLDDLDKELNTYAMRVREWFGWHFPEMTKIVSDNIAYAKVVRKQLQHPSGCCSLAHSIHRAACTEPCWSFFQGFLVSKMEQLQTASPVICMSLMQAVLFWHVGEADGHTREGGGDRLFRGAPGGGGGGGAEGERRHLHGHRDQPCRPAQHHVPLRPGQGSHGRLALSHCLS